MAEILLKVRFDDSTYKSQLTEIEKGIQKIGESMPKTAVANVDSLQKSFANLLNTLKGTKDKYPVDTFAELETKITACLGSVKSLNAAIGDNKPTKEQRQELAKLNKEFQDLSARFATVRVESTKLNTAQGTSTKQLGALQKQVANLITTLQSVKNKYPAGTFDKIESDARAILTNTKALSAEVGENTTLTAEQTVKYEQLDSATQRLSTDIATLKAETEQNTSAVIKNGDSILSMAKKFVVWQAAATLVMQPLNAIKNAISSINETLVETEDRIIELKRVLPTGSVGDSEMAKQLYDLAAQYGQTFENVSDIALNFARTGMSWADTIKATEAAVLALNVAELDATQASNGMIAIMQQFGYEASDLTEIIDKLNKTADNYAVTTDKLLTALQRTGSSAKNARLELDQTIGVITALSEATGRSGENLGTAVNSLIQFSTKSQSLETFAKLSDNMAKIVEDYQHGQGTVLDIWKGLSTEIKNASGNSESILGGLFGDEDWRTLNAELQEQLGENFATVTEIYDTASTFRKNYFIALLNNMDTVQDSINTMQGSLGYSQKENEQYLDTYTAKLNTLQAKWQKIANSEQGLLGIKKALVDVATILLKIIERVGGLRTVLIAISTIVWMLVGTKIISGIKAIGTAIASLVTGLKAGATAARGFQAALGWIGVLGVAISTVVGIVQQFKQEQEELVEVERRRNEEAVAKWKNEKEQISQLQQLYSQYSNLTSADENYYQIEQQIVKLLGDDKTRALKSLTGDTEKYSQTVKNNTEYLLANAEAQKKAALQAVKNQLADVNFNEFSGMESDFYENSSSIWKKIANISSREQNAFEVTWNRIKAFFTGDEEEMSKLPIAKTFFSVEDFDDSGTFEATLKNYELLLGYQTKLIDLANEYELDNKDTRAIYNVYNIIQTKIDALAPLINDYKELMGELTDDDSNVNSSTKKWADNLSEIKNGYDEIVSAIEEMRDANKEALDYEEKKLAVLEAEKALEDARNQATVRRFNQTTGQWEWQVDEKAVKTAEENLDKARLAVEEAAYKSIIEELKKDSTSNEKILEIIAKWAEAYGSGDFSGISNDILKIIHETGKVNIGDFQHTPTYDSGGVLHGLGGIKATAKDEIVLPPEITSKILQPTSNAQFKAFCDGLGILFGSPQISPTTQIERIGGNIDNRINNSGQVFIQGVNVGTEKRDGILDALALAPIMSDN